MLRRSEREPLLRLGVGQRNAREGKESRSPLRRILEQILTRRRFLSHAARDLEMMGRIRPGAFDLSVDGRLLIGDDDRVGGKQLEEVAAARSRGSGRLELFGFHREDSHPTQDLAGPLRVQVEAAHRRNLVAPPFDPRGRRHPEAIHVENAAPDAVLRDFRHCRHTRVPHPNQSLRGLGQTPCFFTDFDDEARLLERSRDGGPLSGGSCGGDQNANGSAQ